MKTKEGPFSKFAKAIQEIHKQRPTQEAIVEFNRFYKRGKNPSEERQKPVADEKLRRKIARPTESEL